jgi:hypothetical protein
MGDGDILTAARRVVLFYDRRMAGPGVGGQVNNIKIRSIEFSPSLPPSFPHRSSITTCYHRWS